MNLLLVPAIVSLVAVGLLVLSMGVGAVLQLSRQSAPVGRLILWYSATALLLAIIFAWLAPIVLVPVLGLALGRDLGFSLGLWGGGPIGLIVGLVWARRNPGGQHVVRGKLVRWCILGGVAFVLVGLGLWLAWEGAMGAVRPSEQIGFWTWLAHIVGLK